MQKLMGIVLMVVGIWVGIEIYTQGIDGAFGGIFASSRGAGEQTTLSTQPTTPPDNRTVVRRAGDRVQSHMDEGAARIEEQVEQE